MQVFNPEFVANVRAKRLRGGIEMPMISRADRRKRRIEAAAALKEMPSLPAWVKEIVLTTCRRHELSPLVVLAPVRTKGPILCRREIMWRLRNDARQPSLLKIAAWMNLDHTTVMHAIRKEDEQRNVGIAA